MSSCDYCETRLGINSISDHAMKTPTKYFSHINIGSLDKIDQYIFNHPKLSKSVAGKHFLKEELGLTSMEVSFNKLPPGASMPFSHKHRENEELYIFLKGKGEFCVDGDWFPVQEGSAVKVSPNGARTWRNISSEDLIFIVVQAKAGTLNNALIDDGVLVVPSLNE